MPEARVGVPRLVPGAVFLLRFENVGDALGDGSAECVGGEQFHDGSILTAAISSNLLSEPSIGECTGDHSVAEDRQPVQIATVWSLPDALKLQALLDQAEILFFVGEGKATRAEAVTADFGKGVPVEAMQVGLPWAQQVMRITTLQTSLQVKEISRTKTWRSIAPDAIRRT